MLRGEGLEELYRRIDTMDLNSMDEVVQWAREYGRQSDPLNPMTRYSIGAYQLKQAAGWKKSRCGYECLAAFFVHTFAAAELLGFSMCEKYQLPWMVDDFIEELFVPTDLYGITLVGLQFVVYRVASPKGSVRWERSNGLGGIVAEAGARALAMIPKTERREALRDAMLSMCGGEWKL
jgi:hypothetical protein